jgi:hypothetical protein
VAPGVDLERLARRCRTLGVEVVVDGEIYRTRTVSPGKGSGPRRLDSSSNVGGRNSSSRPPAMGRTPAVTPSPSRSGGYRSPSSARQPENVTPTKRRTGE